MAGNPFEITRVLDAPRDAVYEAWTNPHDVQQWWGPFGFSLPFCHIDLRPGAGWQYCMRSPDGRDYWCKGVYRVIEPGRRIASTDAFCDADGNRITPTAYGMSPDWPEEMTVEVTFADEDGRTRLTVRQSVDAELARQAGAVQGWNETLERLARHVEGKG